MWCHKAMHLILCYEVLRGEGVVMDKNVSRESRQDVGMSLLRYSGDFETSLCRKVKSH